MIRHRLLAAVLLTAAPLGAGAALAAPPAANAAIADTVPIPLQHLLVTPDVFGTYTVRARKIFRHAGLVPA